jgi:5'-3' exonuclease
VDLHLVDATYELFRAYHAPRPPVRGRGGMSLTAVAGLAGTLLALVRDEGATHVGCAHDRVIHSARNDLWPAYKSEAGVPEDLLAQFPVAEEAITALGFVLWPMVEWEADDALATAAVRWADAPGVDRILVCTPDKDLAQVVRDGRVVLRDRRRDITYDEAGVRAKWGVPPAAIPDYLALVGDAADGFPGIPGFGSKGAAALLTAFGIAGGDPRGGSPGLARHGARRRPAGRDPPRPVARCAPVPRPGDAPQRRSARHAGPRCPPLAGRRPGSLAGVLRALGVTRPRRAAAPLARGRLGGRRPTPVSSRPGVPAGARGGQAAPRGCRRCCPAPPGRTTPLRGDR